MSYNTNRISPGKTLLVRRVLNAAADRVVVSQTSAQEVTAILEDAGLNVKNSPFVCKALASISQGEMPSRSFCLSALAEFGESNVG